MRGPSDDSLLERGLHSKQLKEVIDFSEYWAESKKVGKELLVLSLASGILGSMHGFSDDPAKLAIPVIYGFAAGVFSSSVKKLNKSRKELITYALPFQLGVYTTTYAAGKTLNYLGEVLQ